VEVKLQKEQDNPVDANTIAFMCYADSKWERIGYVVIEALPDIHDSLRKQNVSLFWLDQVHCVLLRILVGMQELSSLEAVTGLTL